MTRRTWKDDLFWLAPLVALLAVFLALIFARYPLLGHDYEGFFRYLVAGRWHVAHYGLAPLRYAVHLCGGLPLYGHPNDISYSLAQALTLFVDPLTASMVSLFVMLCAGYAGWYRLGRDVFRLLPSWAHVLALIVAAHGFHFVHALIGHENFATVPLLGWLLWLLLSNDSPRCTLPVRIAWFALLCAIILHAAGYFTLVFFAVFAASMLPCIVFCRKSLAVAAPRTVAVRWPALALAALLLSSSKLVAIWSLMRTFPRTVAMSAFDASTNVLRVVFGSFWVPPNVPGVFQGVPWGLHENSNVLSPVVLVGAVIGVALLVRRLRKKRPGQALFLAVYSVVLVVVCFGLVQGRGPIAQWLHAIPPLSSMRVMMRLLYPFSLVLCIGSVIALQHAFKRRTQADQSLIASIAMVVTVVTLPLAYGPALASFDMRPQPWLVLRQAEEAVRAGYERMPVTQVIGTDTDFLGHSGIQCSGDALLQSAGQQIVRGLTTGPVAQVRGGAFNLINPSCYAYPTENNCTPGDRIAADRSADLQAFTHGDTLPWKVSVAQQGADGVSLFLLVICLGTVLWSALSALRRVLSHS